MPDRFSNPASERGASAPSRKDKELFLRKWFSDPQTYPDEFKAWLRSSLVADPNIVWEVPQIPRLPGTKLVDDSITALQIAPNTITNVEVAAAAAILGSKLNWSVGTSPPGSPLAGDIWVYQGSGLYWMFVWDTSETTYKWKFVGGGPYKAEVPTNETRAGGGGGAIADLATVGPDFVVPRTGHYNFTWGFAAGNFAAASQAIVAIYDVTAAGVFSWNTLAQATAATGGYCSHASSQDGIAAAGHTLRLRYGANNSAVDFVDRWLQVIPVKII